MFETDPRKIEDVRASTGFLSNLPPYRLPDHKLNDDNNFQA